MRIAYIAAGAGASYCGACTRDVALARGLIALGHDVVLMPFYTPLRTDLPDPSVRRVFCGGVSAWLEQHCAPFRGMPRPLEALLNAPVLLRLLSRLAVETRPERLGAMTVSVLRGLDGRQRAEIERTLAFLGEQARPDVVNLTNSLLSGLAPAVRDRLGVPVVCTLQGEEAFVERLGPWRGEALGLLRANAQSVDLFIAPSAPYARDMRAWLGVRADRVQVVEPGIEVDRYAGGPPRPREPFRIGFISRVSEAKGADVLVEAFLRLRDRLPPHARLAIAGEARGAGRRLLRALRRRLRRAGMADRFEYAGEPDLVGKVRFLHRCSVVCLPSRFPERRAMALLEAMGAGRPIVASALGFPTEIVSAEVGATVPPGDPQALADALLALHEDPDAADAMGAAAARLVADRFSARRMAQRTAALYEEVVAGRAR